MSALVARRGRGALYGGLTLASLLWMIPMLTAVAISVLPLRDSREGWWRLDLSDLTLHNYARAWNAGLSDQVVNSFVISLGAVAFTVAAGSLAA